MRRRMIAFAAAGLAGIAAAPASAAPRCSAPSSPNWHSCLNAAHQTISNSDEVRLTRATPELVVRGAASCPERVIARKVTIRNGKGEKLATARVKGKCKKGVSRWRVNIRPALELPKNTVLRSLWSRLDDAERAPRVKLD